MTQLRIDFVSDIACPWCVIGLRSLMRALDKLGDGVTVDLHFQPFELNPAMPPEGQNTFEHVREKYGSTPEKSAAAREVIRDSGEKLGFTFNYGPDSRIWNTFDAHRLLHWAGEQGRQRKMKEALFAANFTDGENVSDHDVLVRAAETADLDGDEARTVLASGRYTEDVRREQAVWRNRGINAVLSIVFEGRWMIQGGQPPEVFEQALRQVLAQKAEQSPG